MIGRKIVGWAAVAAGVYGCWVHPGLMRWGATGEEATEPYPAAELVPGGERAWRAESSCHRRLPGRPPPALAHERFISVTTFKRDGTPVATPVWCAAIRLEPDIR